VSRKAATPAQGTLPRFLLAGVANTAASYLVYLLLLLVLDYRIAYTIAYAVGLATGFWLSSTFVFRVQPRPGHAIGYLASYAIAYLASVLALYVVVDRAHVAKPLGALAALVVSVLVSYVLLRINFGHGRRS
jgi:putative flippase GtrA